MNLEQQLKMAAGPWLAGETLPPGRSAALCALVERRVRNRRWRRLISLSATAAVLVIGVSLWPLVVSVASGTPLVGPYIARMARYDQGAYWANDKGYVVVVSQSATDKGYAFRVDSIVADTARTEIYYTVDGPDLEERSTATVDVTYNGRHPNGMTAGHWAVQEGRITGSLTLPPLPYPTTQVQVIMRDVSGVQGSWKVSFMASRTIPDNLTRTVRVGEKLKGDGYNLTVDELTIAPTETIVAVSGWAGSGFEPLIPQLTADGQTVGWHSSSASGAQPILHPVRYRFAFDRIEGSPAAATFTLGARRWQSGGPVIDLTRPGASAAYGPQQFRLESVTPRNGSTTVDLKVLGTAGQDLNQAFDQWVLTDGKGRTYNSQSGGGSPDWITLIFTGEVPDPVKLEARRHAEPVSGDLSVSIPLR